MTLQEFIDYMREHHLGIRHAIPAGALARALGLKTGQNGRPGLAGSKAVTELAQQARKEGVPIIYGPRGYFVATRRIEFMHYLDENWARRVLYTDRYEEGVRLQGCL